MVLTCGKCGKKFYYLYHLLDHEKECKGNLKIEGNL